MTHVWEPTEVREEPHMHMYAILVWEPTEVREEPHTHMYAIRVWEPTEDKRELRSLRAGVMSNCASPHVGAGN